MSIILQKHAGTDSKTSYDMAGRLYLSDKGWLLLSVPNALMHGTFATIQEPGVELPPPPGDKGSPSAHISVMRPSEIEEHIGDPDKISERGHAFRYTLGPLKSFQPDGWEDISRCWVIQIKSPELEKLRKSYGMTNKPHDNKFEYHITVACRRKRVLLPGDVRKAAEYTATHTATRGSDTFDIHALIERLKNRPISQINLPEISRSRRHGFSQKRYDAADTSHPVIVDESGKLWDGRHRTAKAQDIGQETIGSVVASPQDIEAAKIWKAAEALTRLKGASDFIAPTTGDGSFGGNYNTTVNAPDELEMRTRETKPGHQISSEQAGTVAVNTQKLADAYKAAGIGGLIAKRVGKAIPAIGKAFGGAVKTVAPKITKTVKPTLAGIKKFPSVVSNTARTIAKNTTPTRAAIGIGAAGVGTSVALQNRQRTATMDASAKRNYQKMRRLSDDRSLGIPDNAARQRSNISLRSLIEKYYKDAPGGFPEAIRQAQRHMRGSNQYGLVPWDPEMIDVKFPVDMIESTGLFGNQNFGVVGGRTRYANRTPTSARIAVAKNRDPKEVENILEHELTHVGLERNSTGRNISQQSLVPYASYSDYNLPPPSSSRNWHDYATTPEELKAYLSPVKRKWVEATGKQLDSPVRAAQAIRWWLDETQHHDSSRYRNPNTVNLVRDLQYHPYGRRVLQQLLLQTVQNNPGTGSTQKLANPTDANREKGAQQSFWRQSLNTQLHQPEWNPASSLGTNLAQNVRSVYDRGRRNIQDREFVDDLQSALKPGFAYQRFQNYMHHGDFVKDPVDKLLFRNAF